MQKNINRGLFSYEKRPAKETCKRELRKRPTKKSDQDHKRLFCGSLSQFSFCGSLLQFHFVGLF